MKKLDVPKIKEALRKRGYNTANEVGEALNVSEHTVYKWWHRVNNISMKNLEKISELTGISVSELLSDAKLAEYEVKDRPLPQVNEELESYRKIINEFTKIIELKNAEIEALKNK